ncbi:MAG TPA: deoxyribose-phosphate aldolase [Acidimicrobiia bacterium]|nr:deoxyribose-phosphate aldolase [Acidimicrobiia bacterium]
MTLITDSRYEHLLRTRAHNPELIAEKAALRKRRSLLGVDGKMVIVAIDHPARRILKVGADPLAMANRRDVLERTVRALRRPGVDGLLATPDIAEDLLLLDELEEKVVFGSMNRGGLTGSAWELSDRITGYDPVGIERAGWEGGKMLLRLDYEDPGTETTIQVCVSAVNGLAERGLVALVEPLPARHTENGKVSVLTAMDAVVEAVAIASALGNTTAHTWLKLPAVAAPERMMAATTLPSLLLGGDPGDRASELLESWRSAMTIPHVRGLVAGRSLLFPADGQVERWVDAAVEIVHG